MPYTPASIYIAVPAPQPAKTATSLVIPMGSMITQLVLYETAGFAMTGGLNIGTTPGGVDVLLAFPITANLFSVVPQATVLKHLFSMTADTTLYIDAAVAWGGAVVNVYFVIGQLA